MRSNRTMPTRFSYPDSPRTGVSGSIATPRIGTQSGSDSRYECEKVQDFSSTDHSHVHGALLENVLQRVSVSICLTSIFANKNSRRTKKTIFRLKLFRSHAIARNRTHPPHMELELFDSAGYESNIARCMCLADSIIRKSRYFILMSLQPPPLSCA